MIAGILWMIGATLFLAGLWLIWHPLAFLFAGIAFGGAALLVDREQDRAKREKQERGVSE